MTFNTVTLTMVAMLAHQSLRVQTLDGNVGLLRCLVTQCF